MKARLFMFMALVLGLVSCQNEPDEMNVLLGGEQEVMLTVSLPEATRADSADGALDNSVLTNYDLRYILEVYYGEECNRFVQTSTTTSAVFPVRLAPGRDYTFVVWADFVTKGANAEQDIDLFYETSAGLKAIQIIEGMWAPMVEARDAYVGSKTIDNFQTSSNLEMELKRPFAKVRVVSTDIEQLRGVGIVPTTAQATYSQNMYRKFNAATGVASDAATKTHTFAYANVDSYEANTDSKLTIFSDYIFVPAEGVAKFTLEVWDGEATPRSIKQNNFNTDIHVEENKVTSIVGDVLTTGGNVKVTINGDLGEKETITVVDNAQSLQEIINKGEQTNITLGGDIDLGDLFGAGILSTRATAAPLPIVVAEGKSLVLDLNGYKITTPWENQSEGKHYYAFDNKGSLTIQDSKGNGEIIARGIFNYGTMTLKSGTINACDGNGGYGVRNYEDAEFIMDGGSIVTSNEDGDIPGEGYDASPVRVDEGATATINGGVINNVSNYTFAIDNYGTTTINGGTFTTIHTTITNSASMTINGGSFICNGLEGITAHALWAAEGTTTINGGTFDGKDNYNGFNVDASKDAIVNISGGKFLSAHSGSLYGEGTINVMGGEFFDDPSKFVNDDYTAVQGEDGKWNIVRKPDVAKIGDEGYTSLAKAVAAAQNGNTITFVADVEQVDGVLITDKNITIDLGGKTFTVTEGANTNNRNFKVNGSSVVTIKNGTMVAQGEIKSGAYGTLRTEGTANVTLNDVKLYNYRGNGLNVKVCTGTTVTINNSEIYSQYGGGVEAAGGTVELNNVTIDQKGIYSSAAWNSVAIGVNGNGKVTVNSGNYSASAISTDANAAQGTWVAYVMSSGGTLDIKGGTFNGIVAETAAAANACGLICADRAAVVEIHGGTFDSNGAILDMRNNVGTQPNPKATLFGGTFSADPRVSGLYSSNLITVADGYKVVEENGIYTVVVDPVAKIGETEYATLEAAAEAAENGDTITVLKDVALSSTLTLPAGITFNGNGKQIDGTISAGGNLTFVGHTKVTSFSASYYNRVITIGEGACLEVTGTGRVTLGYGNTFHITGSVENAKTAVKEDVQPSLIIPGGISITGGNDAAMNVTDAYVKIGSTTSKPGVASGTFTLNFNNAIAEFTKEFGFYEPTGSANPTFVMNIKDSVFTTGTKLFVTAESTVTVDNSNVPLGSYFRNSGTFTLTNGSVMTGATIQFGENGGNNGTINVDKSTLTITTGNNKGQAFDGKGIGKISAVNGATVSVEYYKDMTIEVDETSTFIGTNISK